MYTVRFQLELSGSEKRFLSKSFFYANQMHNQLARHATNRLSALFHDKEYMDWKCSKSKSYAKTIC